MTERGFTLIELMITIAILAIIAAGASISLDGAKRKSDLDSSATIIVSSLRGAQVKALDGKDFKNWGIRFDSANGKSALITDDGIQKMVIEENYLPASVRFNASSLSGGCNEIIFTRPKGETSRDCTVRIESLADLNIFRNIAIKTTGFVGSNP